tara:strand:+ start:1400 stop:2020 length:621 start_codon:yes stop_codon:yes gene_type:complete
VDFYSYDVYIFDFDGTLVLSNEIKEEAFYFCANNFLDGRAIMKSIKESFYNKDRYTIFTAFIKHYYQDKSVFENEYKAILTKYKKYTINQIINAEPVPGSIDVLKNLRVNNKKIFVNSATPLDSLKQSVEGRGLDIYFDRCFGMESNKSKNILEIARITSANLNSIIMIGDGLDDKEAADHLSVSFFPVGKLLSGRPPSFLNLVKS